MKFRKIKSLAINVAEHFFGERPNIKSYSFIVLVNFIFLNNLFHVCLESKVFEGVILIKLYFLFNFKNSFPNSVLINNKTFFFTFS